MRKLRARELFYGIGEQLHELLEQHVLGRVGLKRLRGLQQRAVCGRRLNVVHRILPCRPVQCGGHMLRMCGRDVFE